MKGDKVGCFHELKMKFTLITHHFPIKVILVFIPCIFEGTKTRIERAMTFTCLEIGKYFQMRLVLNFDYILNIMKKNIKRRLMYKIHSQALLSRDECSYLR